MHMTLPREPSFHDTAESRSSTFDVVWLAIVIGQVVLVAIAIPAAVWLGAVLPEF